MSKYRVFQIIFGFIFVVSLLWLLFAFFLRGRQPQSDNSFALAATPTPNLTATAVSIFATRDSASDGESSEESGDIATPNGETLDVYVVISGDTLNSIARKFNVTVLDIQQLNGLPANPNLIDVGQVLEIPNDLEITPIPTVSNKQLALHLDNLEATVVAAAALAEMRETAVLATSAALATQVSQLDSTVEAMATSLAEANSSESQNEREDCTHSDKSLFEKIECWMGVYVVPLLGLVSSSFGLVGSIFAERKDKEEPPTAEERRAEEMRWELLKMEAELKQLKLMKARREWELLDSLNDMDGEEE